MPGMIVPVQYEILVRSRMKRVISHVDLLAGCDNLRGRKVASRETLSHTDDYSPRANKTL